MGLNLRPLLDLTPEQRAERNAENIAFAHALGAEHKARREASIIAARRPSPRGKPTICMAMVIHRRLSNGIVASMDGSDARAVRLYDKAGIVIEGNAGRWSAVTMPKWLRTDRGLFGDARSALTPEECATVEARIEAQNARVSILILVDKVNARLSPARPHIVERDRFDRGARGSFSPW